LVEKERPILGVICTPASMTFYFGDIENK